MEISVDPDPNEMVHLSWTCTVFKGMYLSVKMKGLNEDLFFISYNEMEFWYTPGSKSGIEVWRSLSNGKQIF